MNLNGKLRKKLRDPTKNLGAMAHPGPSLESPLVFNLGSRPQGGREPFLEESRVDTFSIPSQWHTQKIFIGGFHSVAYVWCHLYRVTQKDVYP